MGHRWPLVALAVVALLGCEGDDDTAIDSAIDSADPTSTADTKPADTTPVTDPAPAAATATTDAPGSSPATTTRATSAPVADTTVPIDDILAELEANGFCDEADIEGTGDVGTVTAMHFVVDAQPAAPCFGTRDDRLDQAWSELAAVTPVELLDDISLLAGYEACEGCDTLAFVSALDEAGTFFLMAIDVTAAQDEPDELPLTLLHELAHVFTQDAATQLDIDRSPAECDTYHNGDGCLTEQSYLWDWMTRFWDPETLAAFDEGAPDEDAGEERCELDGAYTGPYGASSPEEDFAEVFAAYVFEVEFGEELDDKLAFFDDYDEFVQIRARAVELGRTGIDNSFEQCG